MTDAERKAEREEEEFKVKMPILLYAAVKQTKLSEGQLEVVNEGRRYLVPVERASPQLHFDGETLLATARLERNGHSTNDNQEVTGITATFGNRTVVAMCRPHPEPTDRSVGFEWDYRVEVPLEHLVELK